MNKVWNWNRFSKLQIIIELNFIQNILYNVYRLIVEYLNSSIHFEALGG